MLREHDAEVAAPPDAVFAALVTRLEPRDGTGFAADAASRLLVVQGDYWYRAEYRVEPTPTGSRVRHAVVNVAAGPRLLGALTGLSVVRASGAAFARLLDGIEAAR